MDKETFLHILKIARLRLKEDEINDFLRQFDEIFSLMERVKSISFSGEYEEELMNPLRKDEPQPFDGDITLVFPKKRDRYLKKKKNL